MTKNCKQLLNRKERKEMKKISLLLVIVILLSLCLVGCGEKPKETQTDVPNDNTENINEETNDNNTEQDSTGDTTQEEAGDAAQEETGEETQEETEDATQESNEETDQENDNDTTQEETNNTTQESNEETTQENDSETTQEDTDDTTQEQNEETTQENDGDTTQENSGETTQESNEEVSQEDNDTTQENTDDTAQENDDAIFSNINAEEPILITSFGQSADSIMVKTIFDKAGITYDHDASIDSGSISEYKTIVLVPGASTKGLGAAGIEPEEEIERIKEINDAIDGGKVTVIVAHIGGSNRRGELSDQMIDISLEKADAIIIVESGDEDGKFSTYAKDNSIQLESAATILDTIPLFEDIFK